MVSEMDRIVFVGNYLPRRCGMATFTTDLCEAVAGAARHVTCGVVALNDRTQGYLYPPRVRFEITQTDMTEYADAGAYLNFTRNDVVCVQHEYGIFGGSAGSHILSLLSDLRSPIVTTLHSVLREPDENQRAVLVELANLSDRLVVMSMKAVGFLQDVCGIEKRGDKRRVER